MDGEQDLYSIDDLADLGGASRRTVRYYVQEGLLPAPQGVGRGRHYGRPHLDRLLEVKAWQEAGLSLDDAFFRKALSMIAAISFFSARVSTEYIEDNTTRILIWTGAAILPAVAAFCRVNTHWHFPTDVMAGYAIGALIGYFIPEIHKTKSGIYGNLSVYPSINLNKTALSLLLKF